MDNILIILFVVGLIIGAIWRIMDKRNSHSYPYKNQDDETH